MHSPILLTENDIFVPGSIKPEADYLEIERLGKKLGIPVPMTFIEVESRAPDGELIGHYKDRSRTFNRNYWNWILKSFAFMAGTAGTYASDTTYGAGHITNKNTAGTVQNANASYTAQPRVYAPDIVTTAALGVAKGIVVGTGVAAESFEDVALGGLIAHGTGAGQLSHAAMVLQTPTYSTLVWTNTLVRLFNNNSGGTIVVGETGLYADFNAGAQLYMICRDKLGATVSVLNAGQLTVTYTTTLTFPA